MASFAKEDGTGENNTGNEKAKEVEETASNDFIMRKMPSVTVTANDAVKTNIPITDNNNNNNNRDDNNKNTTNNNDNQKLPSRANQEPTFKGYLLEPEPYDDSDEDEEAKTHANYFDWKIHFPQITELVNNVDVVREEMRALKDWRPWPETNLYSARKEWNVFPFLHTFPATDQSKVTWVPHFCNQCPKTTAMLKKIKGIRTALLSRMGPGTVLAAHRGWADLSNHVLRLHLALEVPEGNACGLWVRGEKQFHKEGEVLCFDDSKLHKAFNLSEKQRTVLIFDIIRPDILPLGTAKKGHTDQLDDFIAWFQ